MKKILLTLLFCLIAFPAWGATVTWQGDESAAWETGGNWDTGSAPTSSDDVVLTTANACTLAASTSIRSLNASTYTGTFTHNASVTLSIGDGTAGAGNVALAFNTTANMTYTLGNATSSAISFVSTSTTVQTVSFNGHNTGNVSFGGASNGSWQLTSTWGTSSVSASQITTLVRTTLDVNGQTVYWGKFYSVNNTRTITLGASTINLYNTGDAWEVRDGTQTITANTATIIFNGNGSDFNQYPPNTFGGELRFVGSGTQSIQHTGGTYANITRTGTAAKTDILEFRNNSGASATNTITGTFTVTGNSAVNRVLVMSGDLGTARTITNTGATMTWSNVDFRDISLGTAYDASAITGGSGNCGGNTNITFTTADDWYFNRDGANTSNFSDYNYWYDATDGGGTQMASTRAPLPQDTMHFDANSFTGTSTITANMLRYGNVDWTGSTQTTTWSGFVAGGQFYGSLDLTDLNTFNSGVGTGLGFIGARGSHSVDMAGLSFSDTTSFAAFGATYTCTGDFRATGNNFNFTNGTLDANDYNIYFNTFEGSGTAVRAIIMGSGTWYLNNTATWTTWNTATITNLTVTPETSTINFGGTSGTGNQTFSGGGKTFYNFTVPTGSSGYVRIVGSNTFNTFTITAPKTVQFTAGTTQTVNSLVATGTGANHIALLSTVTDTIATISDANGGTNENDYLDVNDIVATQANTFYYGANGSADAQSTNWLATAGGAAARRIMLIN